MPGPLHAPPLIVLYPFRFRDPVTGRWVRARYFAERRELDARYAQWEIVGEPEYRTPIAAMFNPLRRDA